MNKLCILCLLVVCVAVSQALSISRPEWDYGRYPLQGCIDHNGNRVEPGGSYYDGCNWCRCGRNGRPGMCTMRACDFHMFRNAEG